METLLCGLYASGLQLCLPAHGVLRGALLCLLAALWLPDCCPAAMLPRRLTQDNLVMRTRESARSKGVNNTRTPSAFDSSGGFNGTTAASNPLTGQGLLHTLPHLHTVRFPCGN